MYRQFFYSCVKKRERKYMQVSDILFSVSTVLYSYVEAHIFEARFSSRTIIHALLGPYCKQRKIVLEKWQLDVSLFYNLNTNNIMNNMKLNSIHLNSKLSIHIMVHSLCM